MYGMILGLALGLTISILIFLKRPRGSEAFLGRGTISVMTIAVSLAVILLVAGLTMIAGDVFLARHRVVITERELVPWYPGRIYDKACFLVQSKPEKDCLGETSYFFLVDAGYDKKAVTLTDAQGAVEVKQLDPYFSGRVIESKIVTVKSDPWACRYIVMYPKYRWRFYVPAGTVVDGTMLTE